MATFNPFTTGNPFLATNLLGFSMGRGSGALKGLIFTVESVYLVHNWYTSNKGNAPVEVPVCRWKTQRVSQREKDCFGWVILFFPGVFFHSR